MNAPRFARPRRGECWACGRSYQLNQRGELVEHPEPPDPYATVRLASRQCLGVGDPPVGGK